MAISAKITLTSAGGNTGPFDLYSNPTSPSINGTLFASGITRADLLLGYTSDVVPTGTSVIRCKSNNGICTNYQDFSLILPTLTPTPTKTVTPTPTTTTYYYWLKMLRCDEDPSLLNYKYSMNSFENNSIQRGDIFRGGPNGLGGSPPAGWFYYTVVDLLLTNPNPTPFDGIEGSKSVSPYALTCDEDPTHFIAATYRTAKFKTLVRYSGYTSYTQIKNGMCGKNISQIYTSPGVTEIFSTAYADPSVTGTTLTPGVLYELYINNIDGSPKWTNSGNYWWGAQVYGSNGIIDYIVRIEDGTITEWRDCTTGEIIYV